MLSGGKLGGRSELAEKVRPQAACWEEGDHVMLSLCRHPPLRRRGPERRHCHGGKKKMALRWCPGKPRRGVQAAVGAGAALGWRSSGLLPWGGPGRVCSQPQLSSSPAPFLSGLGCLAPLPVSLQRQKPGAKLTAASPPPRSLSWVSLCLCLSVSLSLSPESSTSFSPAPFSCCLEPGS